MFEVSWHKGRMHCSFNGLCFQTRRFGPTDMWGLLVDEDGVWKSVCVLKSGVPPLLWVCSFIDKFSGCVSIPDLRRVLFNTRHRPL